MEVSINMGEYFKAKLDQVHELIDQGEYLPAIELTRNLKNKILDKIPLDKINSFEKEVEDNFNVKWNELEKSPGGPQEKQGQGLNLLKMKAQKYERFYLHVNNDYDL